jgi:alpha-beta hydrolase superfamily lysophospholipase
MILTIFLIIVVLLLIIYWALWVSKGSKTEIRFTPKDYQLEAQTVLVLESSYYSFKNVAKRWMWKHAKIPYFPVVSSMISWKEHKLGQKVESFALQQTASKITCPVLMIQGGKDKLPPVSKAQKTYNLLTGPKELWVVAQAGHLSCYKIDENAYKDKITRFFQHYF